MKLFYRYYYIKLNSFTNEEKYKKYKYKYLLLKKMLGGEPLKQLNIGIGLNSTQNSYDKELLYQIRRNQDTKSNPDTPTPIQIHQKIIESKSETNLIPKQKVSKTFKYAYNDIKVNLKRILYRINMFDCPKENDKIKQSLFISELDKELNQELMIKFINRIINCNLNNPDLSSLDATKVYNNIKQVIEFNMCYGQRIKQQDNKLLEYLPEIKYEHFDFNKLLVAYANYCSYYKTTYNYINYILYLIIKCMMIRYNNHKIDNDKDNNVKLRMIHYEGTPAIYRFIAFLNTLYAHTFGSISLTYNKELADNYVPIGDTIGKIIKSSYD